MGTHTSFREALGAASARIEENILTSAIGELKERSERAISALTETYQEFFLRMLQAIDPPGVHGDVGGLPTIFEDLPNGPSRWATLSPDWMKRKSRGTAPDVLNIYRGLSEGRRTGMRGQRNAGELGPVKKSRRHSFRQHIEKLSRDRSAPGRIFGNPKIGYALIRPDGGKVYIYQNQKLPGAIGKIQQHEGEKFRFAKAIDGTKLQAQLWAFPKLEGLLPAVNDAGEVISEEVEDRVARFVGQKDKGAEKQWVKIYGQRAGPYWRLRPLITPLIQWYLQDQFEEILKDIAR